MYPILIAATAYQNYCSLGYIDQNNWISINLLIILASVMIAALIYFVGNFLPTEQREKVSNAVKYEGTQLIISVAIIMVLVAFASFTCSIGSALVGGLPGVQATGYTDPMQFAQNYLSTLLFIKGQAIVTELYSNTIASLSAADSFDQLGAGIAGLFGYSSDLSRAYGVSIEGAPNPSLSMLIFSYSTLYSGIYPLFMVISFGVLLLFFLFLPIIEALALTLVVPLSLLMRSVAFLGPRLREAADTFLSLAVAFYFIFPLMIGLDYYIGNWMFCTGPAGTACNPYTQYTGPDSFNLICNFQFQSAPTGSYGSDLTNVPVASLFTTSTTQISGGGLDVNIPNDFYGPGTLLAGFVSPYEILSSLAITPALATCTSLKVSEYLFEAVVLLALDMAVTIGFAQGLAKGLGAVGDMLGTGSFWGDH